MPYVQTLLPADSLFGFLGDVVKAEGLQTKFSEN